MSAVRLSKIKFNHLVSEDGPVLFGTPSVHYDSGIIYLPLPKEGKILRIDTVNDHLLEPLTETGWITGLQVSQDREIVFAFTGDLKEIRSFRAGHEDSKFSIEIDVYPESAAFDSERDLLLVMGSENPPPDPVKVLRVYRFPECKNLGELTIEGKPVSVKYDDLEDQFVILSAEPTELNFLDPSAKLVLERTIGIGENNPTSFELCPSDRQIVVAFTSGSIHLVSRESKQSKVLASFREPVSKMLFNPLLDHLYVTFDKSRFLVIIDMETKKIRETVKCSSEISHVIFDRIHNKFYVFSEKNRSVEVYLDQGR